MQELNKVNYITKEYYCIFDSNWIISEVSDNFFRLFDSYNLFSVNNIFDVLKTKFNLDSGYVINKVAAEKTVVLENITALKCANNLSYRFEFKSLIGINNIQQIKYIIQISENAHEIDNSVNDETYDQFFNSSPAIKLLIDPETGAIVKASPSAVIFYGYPADKFLKMNISEINTLSKEQINQEMQNSLNLNRNYFLFKHRMADGQIKDVEIYAGPVKINNKNYLYSIINDITERLKIEKAFNNLHNDFVEALNSLSSPVALIDEMGNIAFLNNSWCNKTVPFLGNNLKIGDNFLDALNSKTMTGIQITKLIINEFINFIGTARDEYNYEYEYNGNYFLLKASFFKSSGDKILIINENITLQKKIELEQKNNETRLEALNRINNMSEFSIKQIADYSLDAAINLSNSDMGFLAFMDEAESVLTMYSWSGKVVNECKTINKPIIYKVENAGYWCEAARTRKPVTVNDYSASSVYKKGVPQGHVPIYKFISLPVIEDDKIVLVAAVSNKKTDYNELDVDNLKMLFEGMWKLIKRKIDKETIIEANEKLEKIDKIKTDFLSMVSHELRTPLTSIIGFNKLIKKKFNKIILPELNINDENMQKTCNEISEFFGIILSEGLRLTNLINDVLDISKIEAGKIEWNMQSIDAAEIIDSAVKSTLPLFQEKKLYLEIDIKPDLPKITGDLTRLVQVVINLFSNAIKFSNEGTVKCSASNFNETELLISVVDTGIGIGEEEQKDIFAKFKQASNTLNSSNKERGTGLGLAICREIVNRHGGRIWVESKAGSGSIFSFTVPINYSDNKWIQNNVDALLITLRENIFDILKSGKNIFLLIESDKRLLNLLEIAVKIEDFKPICFSNPLDAIVNLKNIYQKPDVIIINQNIQKTSDINIVSFVKNDPALFKIPIFIVKYKEEIIDSKPFFTIENYFVG